MGWRYSQTCIRQGWEEAAAAHDKLETSELGYCSVTPLSPQREVSMRREGLPRDLVGDLKGEYGLEINYEGRTGCDD